MQILDLETQADLLRMMNHDIRNPLSNIQLLLRLLEKHGTLTDEKGQKYLAYLRQSATDLVEVVERTAENL